MEVTLRPRLVAWDPGGNPAYSPGGKSTGQIKPGKSSAMFGQIHWGGIPALPTSFPRGNVPCLEGSGREATARARPRAQRPKGDDGQDPVLRLRVSPAATGETDRPLPPVLRLHAPSTSDRNVRGRRAPPSPDLPSSSKFLSPPVTATAAVPRSISTYFDQG